MLEKSKKEKKMKGEKNVDRMFNKENKNSDPCFDLLFV